MPNTPPASPAKSTVAPLLFSSAQQTSAPPPYLRNAVATFPNPGSMWHLMTNLPTNFADQCKMFKGLLATFKFKIVTPGQRTPISDMYDTLAQKVYACIKADNGVYYAATERGDPDNHDHLAPHIAQSILIENITGKLIRNCNHGIKGRNVLRCITNLINKNLIPLKNLIEKQNPLEKDLAIFEPLLQQINTMISYLQLHQQCLTAALAYDHTLQIADLDIDVTDEPVVPLLLAWHPGAVKKTTPIKATPTSKRLRDKHAEMKSTKALHMDPADFGSPTKITKTAPAAHTTPITALSAQLASAGLVPAPKKQSSKQLFI